MAEIKIDRSRTGVPVIGVGGGAYTNTFHARTVIRKDSHTPVSDQPTGSKYSLIEAMFVKRSGHLCCDQEQAIVPIKPGYIIVHLTGTLPADDNNPDAQIVAEQVTAIDQDNNKANTEPYPVTFEDIPVLVIRGAETYHNRDGRYFCNADAKEGNDAGNF